jgi:putative acetyltransferase
VKRQRAHPNEKAIAPGEPGAIRKSRRRAMDISIRLETKADHQAVEALTREAFWNLYVPGCNEHYLAHLLRTHPDFIPELDFVAVYGNKIVGNIMFAKSGLVDESKNRMETASFGPISVLPEFQRQGVGSALIGHSMKAALALGYKIIVIHGHPHNYCKHGFKGSKDLNISEADGKYPYSLLVLELEQGLLPGRKWKYEPSAAYDFDPDAADAFDKQFEPRAKEYRYTQEEFRIASRAYIA